MGNAAEYVKRNKPEAKQLNKYISDIRFKCNLLFLYTANADQFLSDDMKNYHSILIYTHECLFLKCRKSAYRLYSQQNAHHRVNENRIAID